MAMDALSKMEIRKYRHYSDHRQLRKSSQDERYMEHHQIRKSSQDDRWAATTLSIASEGIICAICLEEFRDGEVSKCLRIQAGREYLIQMLRGSEDKGLLIQNRLTLK